MLCDRLLEWLEEPSESGRNKRKMRTLKGAAKGGKASKNSKSEPSGKKRKATTTKPKQKAPAKKKQKKTKAPSSDDDDDDDDDDNIKFNIPGTTIEQVRGKVKSIIEKADKTEVTVKMVRKKLEDWLDADLTDHKDAVRALALEAMKDE